MAGPYDMDLVNQAVNAERYSLGLQPLAQPIGMSMPDPLAEQSAMLAAQQQADLDAAGLGPQLAPEQSMSLPPVQAPATENPVDMVSEPLASYPQDAPATQLTAPGANMGPELDPMQRAAQQYLRGGYGAGGGLRNPINGQIADATKRRKELEGQSMAYERQGDQSAAEAQEAMQRGGEARSATAADVAGVQARLAGEGQAYQRQLLGDQESYQRASDRAQNEQRELTQFVSSYQPHDRRSMGQKVTGALAIALSGLGDQANLAAGLFAGTPVQTNNADRAVQMVQAGIERDLQMQAQMLDNKRTAITAKNTELGQLRERYGDSVDTMKLARAMKLEQAGQEMEAMKNRGLSQEALAVADEAIARFNVERNDIYAQVYDQRFNKAFGEEQRLQAIKAAQAAAARPKALTQKEVLDLQGKALDNAIKQRELMTGPNSKLTADEKKRISLFDGTEQAAAYMSRAIADGRSAPGTLARNSPDEFLPADTVELENAIRGMEAVLLRDESGAAISDADKVAKREAWGLTRRDAGSLKRALPLILDEYNARRKSVGLDPINAVVRTGAVAP